jgi:Glycosyltransferase family 87
MITRLAAAAAMVFFLGTAFRSGWRRAETDFPNYYTAAVCIRKGLPLRNFYDWTWFQRQMNFAGIERQLGGFPPHTPLTAVPMVPLAGFPFQVAKRIWLVFSLGSLAASIWLLSRMTGFQMEYLILLAFLGFGALYSNFLYGQYYVFLLFLLTLAFYCVQRGQSAAGGFLCGVTFGLKLYGGPFVLYFLAKRNWKAVAGFLAATVFMGAIAIAMFGWADTHYYLLNILPRALDGEIIDPYNAVNQTYSTVLRRLFFPEPELNPHPLWNAPLAVFFLLPFFTVLIAALTMVGLARRPGAFERRDFAWFMIATLLVSVSLSSYTYIVLLLPVALLLRDAGVRERFLLIAAFVALTFPLALSWHAYFPRLWVLLGLFIFVGRKYWRGVSLKTVGSVVALAGLVASVSAWTHYRAYEREPGRQFEVVAWQPAAIFSSSPAVSQAGLFYQAMGGGKYVLKWLTDGRIRELSFDGEAFQPFVLSADGPIYFELVAGGKSMTMQFDPATQIATQTSGVDLSLRSKSVASPDGRWTVSESPGSGWKELRLQNRESGVERELAAGRCNNTSPVWELDSTAVIFASDCDRSTGLPALYRARISRQ